MATTRLYLSIFYYPNATKPDDVNYAKELMDAAGKIYAPYNISLDIWPPRGEPGPGTILSPVSSDDGSKRHPLMDDYKDLTEIVQKVPKKYVDSLASRLLVVFGRFGKPRPGGSSAVPAATFPDTNGLPQTSLKAFVVIDPQYVSSYRPDQRGTLAHEIGHAAGLFDMPDLNKLAKQIGLDPAVKHPPDHTTLMDGEGQQRASRPALSAVDLILIRNAFFAWTY
jgi:hypothetical protein